MSDGEQLKHKRILVVEDEFLLADDLARRLRAVGVTVIGPVATVAKAAHLIEENEDLDLAVLDVNLRDELIYPVAKMLRERAVPFLFTTGYDKVAIPQEYAQTPRFYKPYEIAEVLDCLVKNLRHAA